MKPRRDELIRVAHPFARMLWSDKADFEKQFGRPLSFVEYTLKVAERDSKGKKNQDFFR
jgi:hypothetical protein